MAHCVSIKHGETICHTSAIEALRDYTECIDEPGVTWFWTEDLEFIRRNN